MHSNSRGGDRPERLSSNHNEESQEAVLQSGTGARIDRMSVAYHAHEVGLELAALGNMVFSGMIESELRLDGVPLVARGNWRSALWYSDQDCDYLELQLFLSESLRIDRQLLLSRNGHFALVADAIVTPAAERIEYRMSLPTANGAKMTFDTATREGSICAGNCTARVFPLTLPQDRVLSTAGGCRERDDRLELSHATTGRGIFLPVLFDWHPRRRPARADWCALTVTEPGRVLRSDQAAGFRLRLGKHQLLIYRNLDGSREARAVLGQHIRFETIVGTFSSAGKVAPIMLVESD